LILAIIAMSLCLATAVAKKELEVAEEENNDVNFVEVERRRSDPDDDDSSEESSEEGDHSEESSDDSSDDDESSDERRYRFFVEGASGGKGKTMPGKDGAGVPPPTPTYPPKRPDPKKPTGLLSGSRHFVEGAEKEKKKPKHRHFTQGAENEKEKKKPKHRHFSQGAEKEKKKPKHRHFAQGAEKEKEKKKPKHHYAFVELAAEPKNFVETQGSEIDLRKAQDSMPVPKPEKAPIDLRKAQNTMPVPPKIGAHRAKGKRNFMETEAPEKGKNPLREAGFWDDKGKRSNDAPAGGNQVKAPASPKPSENPLRQAGVYDTKGKKVGRV